MKMFEIIAGKTSPCELVTEAGEVIAEGTHTACKREQRRLCEHDMKPTDKCGEEHA